MLLLFDLELDHIILLEGTPFTAHTLEIKSANIYTYGKTRISNFKGDQRTDTGAY